MLGRCPGTQERVANVPASWEDKGYVDLPLPSSAIAVHSVPTTASTNVDSCGERRCPVYRRKEEGNMQDGGS